MCLQHSHSIIFSKENTKIISQSSAVAPVDKAWLSLTGTTPMASMLSYESLFHAVAVTVPVAAAVGSVTAISAFFPLDTTQLLLQVDNKS